MIIRGKPLLLRGCNNSNTLRTITSGLSPRGFEGFKIPSMHNFCYILSHHVIGDISPSLTLIASKTSIQFLTHSYADSQRTRTGEGVPVITTSPGIGRRGTALHISGTGKQLTKALFSDDYNFGWRLATS